MVIDGFGVGVGSVTDARFGDQGADTLGHVLSATADLELPALYSLGLGEIVKGRVFDPPARRCDGNYGRMRSRASGADCASEHWELAGSITEEPFATFEQFPQALIDAIEAEAEVEFLGKCSGNSHEALQAFAGEHLLTGKPILLALPDSAVQIAAHESMIAPARFHRICRIARRHFDDWRIRRVIASPFAGSPGAWAESQGRHEYSMVPPRTVLNAISETGFPVAGIGKIGDLFARSGLTSSRPTGSNEETLQAIERIWRSPQNGMIFANLADFDVFGSQRDPVSYARALGRFDEWLGGFMEGVEIDDLLIIAGSHGNDPTFAGNGPTREEIPVLVHYDGRGGPLGIRNTFADVASTLAMFFALREPWPTGKPLITFHRAGYGLA